MHVTDFLNNANIMPINLWVRLYIQGVQNIGVMIYNSNYLNYTVESMYRLDTCLLIHLHFISFAKWRDFTTS